MRKSLLATMLALAALAGLAAQAGAGGPGLGTMPAPAGVTVSGSPYRYVAIDPRLKGAPTVVERIDRDGGRVGRWWYLRGDYYIPAVAYDGSGGGLSADGGTLVLTRFRWGYPPRETRFAVLDTDLHLRHPRRPGQRRPAHAIHRIDLPGFFSLDAISADGRTAFLNRQMPHGRDIDDFEIRAVDTKSGRLQPRPLPGGGRAGRPLSGVPITAIGSADGRSAYTLYHGDDRRIFLLALDTVAGRVRRLELPQLRRRSPFLLRLGFGRAEHELVVSSGSPVAGRPPSGPLLRIDTRLLQVKRHSPQAQASTATALTPLVDFTHLPGPGASASIRVGAVGRSAAGRPIRLKQVGNPSLPGRVLVFGCIHGDECAARGIEPLSNGCPDPHSSLYIVPNLDPDGLANGTRLNGRGVDLNRNFPAEWRPIGAPGDPEFSGPRPFSEPETRLAARVVRQIDPGVTIWFHQRAGPRPLVRAWGQSAPGGRLFAHLARIPFHLLRWMDGTAPNWQNHRFPQTSSYVVELPPGPLQPDLRRRLERAILGIGRWEAQVGED